MAATTDASHLSVPRRCRSDTAKAGACAIACTCSAHQATRQCSQSMAALSMMHDTVAGASALNMCSMANAMSCGLAAANGGGCVVGNQFATWRWESTMKATGLARSTPSRMRREARAEASPWGAAKYTLHACCSRQGASLLPLPSTRGSRDCVVRAARTDCRLRSEPPASGRTASAVATTFRATEAVHCGSTALLVELPCAAGAAASNTPAWAA